MKKLLVCLTIIVAIGGTYYALRPALYGRPYTYSTKQDISQITGIDIVQVVHSGYLTSKQFEKVGSQISIPQERWSELIDNVQEINCTQYPNYYVVNSFNGWAIRICYADGAIELIGNYSGFYCDRDGNMEFLQYDLLDLDFDNLIQSFM